MTLLGWWAAGWRGIHKRRYAPGLLVASVHSPVALSCRGADVHAGGALRMAAGAGQLAAVEILVSWRTRCSITQELGRVHSGLPKVGPRRRGLHIHLCTCTRERRAGLASRLPGSLADSKRP